MPPEQALADAGLALPALHPAVANYAMAVRTGSLLFLSGHGSFVDGQPAYLGKLGADLSTDDGYQAAKVVLLNLLATVRAEVGELSRVARWIKLVVLVNATPDFTEQHLVANGATDLLAATFGDIGRPARTAMGVAALPLGFAVEIEGVVEVMG
jgi:enamine deaminase RidA (YjgF/YER057c/UK114 family)